ncbi:hypothetical protein [Commensalibacter communis]|uniref:hypothetical protein n=1 Tax=Commensalibacter communis TaxID=2972786 RepID=UPI0022FF82D4|nr:hypothetical protein [Commensalibacter communis]CAI3947993.1 unnamed protein product [Commensalibacter communis]CAI3948238.1 unnamed protein product [Commensalibacter communis]
MGLGFSSLTTLSLAHETSAQKIIDLQHQANQGNAEAQFTLEALYDEGEIISRNKAQDRTVY